MIPAHRHPLTTGDPARLAPAFSAAYGLDGAAMVLGVGSQVEQVADPSSDIDVLALFEGVPPDTAPDDAVDMRTVHGPNWIGWYDTAWGRREVNVECLSLDTVLGMAAQLAPPFGPRRAPVLQALEVRTLARLTTAVPLTGDGRLDALRASLHLDRLPGFVALINVVGTRSYLHLAQDRTDDALGCHIALTAVVEGLVLASLALDGRVLYDLKKASAVLRAARQGQLHPVLDHGRVTDMLLSRHPHEQLDRARAALDEVLGRIAARAGEGPSVWTEVHHALCPSGATS